LTLFTKIKRYLFPEEFIAVLFSVIIILYQFIFYFRGDVENFSDILTPLISFIIFLAYIIIFRNSTNKALRFIRTYIQIPYYGIIFTAFQTYAHHLNPVDYDRFLHGMDLKLFCFDATSWFEKFNSNILTEIFTICYFSYYIMPTLTIVLFYFVKADNSSYRLVRNAVLAMIIGWYGAFVFYAILPAAGPDIAFPQNYHTTLTGLSPLTNLYLHTVGNYLRTSFVRNTFPSMHFGILLIINYFAFKWSKKYLCFTLPLAAGLGLATLYLRQHYLVDLLGSFGIAYLSIQLALYVNKPLFETK
jgi:membrane-associated phospholipid phosphatase